MLFGFLIFEIDELGKFDFDIWCCWCFFKLFLIFMIGFVDVFWRQGIIIVVFVVKIKERGREIMGYVFDIFM